MNFKTLSKQAVSEGTILLENNGALPLKENAKIALFGRGCYDPYYTGHGSGGNVHSEKFNSLKDGFDSLNILYNKELENKYNAFFALHPAEFKSWGKEFPYSEEMDFTTDELDAIAKQSDTAIFTISRITGEAADFALEKGKFYFTDIELDLIEKIRCSFKTLIVIINTTNIIDIKAIRDYHIDALILSYMGGSEYGLGLADVLVGNVSPSGKLPATIAKEYGDYPASNFDDTSYMNYIEDIYVGYRYFNTFKQDKILYPFGYGLSYSKFNFSNVNVVNEDYKFNISFDVANIGNYNGKEVAQLYISLPSGELGNPSKILVGFNKTNEIKINEKDNISIKFDLKDFAVYCDYPTSKYAYCYILEKGEYILYLGNSSIDNEKIYSFTIDETIIVKKTKNLFALKEDSLFERMVNKNGILSYEKIPYSESTLKQRIDAGLDYTKYPILENIHTFDDVINNKISLNDFINELSLEDLEFLSYGYGKMNAEIGPNQNAGAICGITEHLRNDLKIPAIITADGPQGVKADLLTTCMPCGSCLSATFNTKLIEQLGVEFGKETLRCGIDTILAPGMNIHRSILCGRNYEYYSEDPCLSGLMAAAMVRGIESTGARSCPKHFSLNNKEITRTTLDSRASMRAMREVYLRNFEIMLKNSNPSTIMTSYNKVNGYWSLYNFDTVQEYLRNELNYQNLLISDWVMKQAYSEEYPTLRNNGYRVRSGVNIIMPGRDSYDVTNASKETVNSLLETYGQDGGITITELRKNAYYVLKYLLK